jgi:hypothetical protein
VKTEIKLKVIVLGVFDWWLSLQPPAHAGSSLADFSTLKMEAIRSSETSVHTRSTRRHIPEGGILHIHYFLRQMLRALNFVYAYKFYESESEKIRFPCSEDEDSRFL